MSSIGPSSESGKVVEINWAERWQVYQRLQELQISCQCFIDRPLEVKIQNPQEAVLLWSVVKHVCSPRRELVNWLNRCWQPIDTTDKN